MAREAEIPELGTVEDQSQVCKKSILSSEMDSREVGRENLLEHSFLPPHPLNKGRSLITFHIDGINETLQQRLLKYFRGLESIPYFHVALVQEFSMT